MMHRLSFILCLSFVLVLVGCNSNLNKKNNSTTPPPTTQNKKELNDVDKYNENVSFMMEIQDVFIIKEVGIVLTGQINSGSIMKNSDIQITDKNGAVLFESTVNEIEIGKNSGSEFLPEKSNTAKKGDNAALYIKDDKIIHSSPKSFFNL